MMVMSGILSLDMVVVVVVAVAVMVVWMGEKRCVVVVVVGGMEKGEGEKKEISTSRSPI